MKVLSKIYNVGFLKGNAYSPLSRLLLDDAQQFYNRSWKCGGESESSHMCLLRESLECCWVK